MARESRIEKQYRRAVKRRGGEAYKFVSPGRRGVPDRIALYDMQRAAERLQDVVNEQIELASPTASLAHWYSLASARNEVERIVADAIQFAELKATGKKARIEQAREHRRLKLKGFRVDIINSIEAADAAGE